MKNISWTIVRRLISLGMWSPPEDWDGSWRRVAIDLLRPVAVIAALAAAWMVIRLIAMAVLAAG